MEYPYHICDHLIVGSTGDARLIFETCDDDYITNQFENIIGIPEQMIKISSIKRKLRHIVCPQQ